MSRGGAVVIDDVVRKCARGCEDGHDVDDWLRAENEVRMPDIVIGVAPEAPAAIGVVRRD
jgi:DUF2934 family protein